MVDFAQWTSVKNIVTEEAAYIVEHTKPEDFIGFIKKIYAANVLSEHEMRAVNAALIVATVSLTQTEEGKAQLQ